MIDVALHMLQRELDAYFVTKNINDEVALENIAFLQTSDENDMRNRLLITLVNLEEESALKNTNPVHRNLTGFEYRPNPVSLNLYLLFSAYYPTAANGQNDKGYIGALKRLSYVISFFQMRNHFTIQDSSAFLADQSDLLEQPLYEDVSKLRLVLDLYTLTFEQINHLWASLGGRQTPFVMYKARLVQIREPEVRREVPLIEEIRSDFTIKSKT